MKKKERVIKSQSDLRKIAALKQPIAGLERALGQKQIQLDFKEKMIEIAEEMYQDIMYRTRYEQRQLPSRP